MLDEMTGSYLARRGKRRFCDKSLGSARFADLLLRIYPGAQFICLYRHPMDVIGSGLDACPWGLNGYGFDQYIGGSPGNAVLALARYWLDHAHADRRGRGDAPGPLPPGPLRGPGRPTPEEVARGVFEFLGVPPAPGITRACFSRDRERFGPADHKIWATSQISGDSVGRGESVPAGLILPPVTAAINELAGELGYLPIDPDWGPRAGPPTRVFRDTIRGRLAAGGGCPPDAGPWKNPCGPGWSAPTDGSPATGRSCMAEKFLVVSRTATAAARPVARGHRRPDHHPRNAADEAGRR